MDIDDFGIILECFEFILDIWVYIYLFLVYVRAYVGLFLDYVG